MGLFSGTREIKGSVVNYVTEPGRCAENEFYTRLKFKDGRKTYEFEIISSDKKAIMAMRTLYNESVRKKEIKIYGKIRPAHILLRMFGSGTYSIFDGHISVNDRKEFRCKPNEIIDGSDISDLIVAEEAARIK